MLFVLLYVAGGWCFLTAQTLKKPELQFVNPCASSGFNTYKVSFSWDPPLVNADNEFVLELSDAGGNFANSTELARVNDMNATFDFDFEFGFPDTTAGDAYRVRVRSTSPEKFSSPSDGFPAYYRSVNQSLTINVINGSVVGNVELCGGGDYELSVYNFPDENAYIWYKDGMEIPGENGASLMVSEAGTYYAVVDYGQYCSSDTASNMVTVTVGESLEVTINNDLPTMEVCPGDNAALTADTDNTDYTYTWYKDGAQVGSPGYMPELTLDTSTPEGEYQVQVETQSGCIAQSNTVQVSAPDISVSTDAGNDVLLLPGETVTITASTTANSPEYTWYKDNVPLSGNTNVLTVSEPGVYKVKVTQTSGCAVEAFSPEVNVARPESFTITIAADENYNSCESASATLQLSGIYAETGGTSLDVYDEYRDAFNYQWYRNGNYLDGRTGTSLAINDPSENGVYTLKATYEDNDMLSNEIDLKLALEETVTIEASDDVLCGGAITINITTNTNNTDYTYAWYKDGEKISENSTTLDIEEEGTYRLGVSAYGCTVFSNELIIQPFDESVITVDASERIIIPEGTSRTITASGGDTYSWYDARGALLSDSESVTVSEEGDITLRAYVGDCEVVREFTVEYQDGYIIPNVVSPNNDGINDQWVLPNIYAFNPDVEVTIYSPAGKVVLRTTEYQNNWPESTLTYSFNKPVFYYRIVKEGKEVVRQGTITLIR